MKHGHTANGKRTPTYHSWRMMRERCNRSKNLMFKYYGARGIKVCKRWDKFTNFLKDMSERPEHMTLDRIDSDKHYCKKNCKWSCSVEQAHNRDFDRYYEGDDDVEILLDSDGEAIPF